MYILSCRAYQLSMIAHQHPSIFLEVQLLERAATWTELVGCQHTVHFHTANATVSLHSMLSSYPGPIKLITVQVRQLRPPCSLPSPSLSLSRANKPLIPPFIFSPPSCSFPAPPPFFFPHSFPPPPTLPWSKQAWSEQFFVIVL